MDQRHVYAAMSARDVVEATLPPANTRTQRPTNVSLTLRLKAKQEGRPPGHVVPANEPRFRETGTATLTARGGTASLKVVGVNHVGENMDMTVVCKPQKTP